MHEECSVHILDYRGKELCNKSIPPVNVVWAPSSSEATQEMEEEMRKKVPMLVQGKYKIFYKFASLKDETNFMEEKMYQLQPNLC